MKMKEYRLFYAIIMLVIAPMAMADDYYDDDIYFDASKTKKKTAKVISNNNQSQPIVNNIDYNYYGGPMRDVDEYNRQGAYSIIDTIGNDSVLNMNGYTYTSRIERFYNPEIVKGSGNQELIESYNVNQPIINIYVDDYWNPYSSWTWGYGYSWSPYYTRVWDPYWNYYGWYNPWYWGWSYCYPYYHHHHHHYPSYSPPRHVGHRVSLGATRTHRPHGTTRYGRGENYNRPSRPNSVSSGTTGRYNRPGVERNNGSLQIDNSTSRGNKNRQGSSISRENNQNRSNKSSYSRQRTDNNGPRGSYSRPSSSSNRGSSGFSGGSRSGGGGRGRR